MSQLELEENLGESKLIGEGRANRKKPVITANRPLPDKESNKMRLSCAVISGHFVILLFSAVSIGLVLTAVLNDWSWNRVKDHPSQRFRLSELQKCKERSINMNLSVPDQGVYDRIFGVKKRDLPFELPFLALMVFSFSMYLIVTIIYLAWKKVYPNLYICLVTNVLGTLIHWTGFGLLLASTAIYSDSTHNYQWTEGCFPVSKNLCSSTDQSCMDRVTALHAEFRECLQKLHVCQLSSFKDRSVFLVLGCGIASSIVVFSTITRIRTYLQTSRIQPKRLSLNSDLSSSVPPPQPSLEASKWKRAEGKEKEGIRSSLLNIIKDEGTKI